MEVGKGKEGKKSEGEEGGMEGEKSEGWSERRGRQGRKVDEGRKRVRYKTWVILPLGPMWVSLT